MMNFASNQPCFVPLKDHILYRLWLIHSMIVGLYDQASISNVCIQGLMTICPQSEHDYTSVL